MSSGADVGAIALVTGGAQGIGRAIVDALAVDGHRVVVADILDDAAQQAAMEVGGLAVHLDVTDRASVDAAVELVEQQLGTIDVLSITPGGMSSVHSWTPRRRSGIG